MTSQWLKSVKRQSAPLKKFSVRSKTNQDLFFLKRPQLGLKRFRNVNLIVLTHFELKISERKYFLRFDEKTARFHLAYPCYACVATTVELTRLSPGSCLTYSLKFPPVKLRKVSSRADFLIKSLFQVQIGCLKWGSTTPSNWTSPRILFVCPDNYFVMTF